MLNILHSRCYNICERKEGKYLVQTRLQTKSSNITLPEVHGIDKGIDPKVQPEKQIIKPIISAEAKASFKTKLYYVRVEQVFKKNQTSYIPTA